MAIASKANGCLLQEVYKRWAKKATARDPLLDLTSIAPKHYTSLSKVKTNSAAEQATQPESA
jgi:hypothetical protein